MSPITTNRLMVLALLSSPLLAVACVPPEEEGIHESESPAVASENGLNSINGLNSLNGLNSMNGFNSLNGLNSMNGLSSTAGLMTSASGRATVSYLVKCALPAGHSIRKQDQYGTWYTFAGALGLAPSWETGAMTDDGRWWVSACMMAHVNTTGVHVPIYLTSTAPSIGMGRSPDYPVQEGSFVGDIFASPPVPRYCGGRGFGSNIVKGRIGDDGQVTKPYRALTDSEGHERCDDICARAPSGDGYTACPNGSRIITVWRKFSTTPTISFETDTAGFINGGNADTTLALDSSRHISGAKSLLATVVSSGVQEAMVHIFNPTMALAGKKMTIYVNVPSGTNWSYIQAFALDGPGKGYRWTNAGYNRNQVIPGEWNSIVVRIPSDFDARGGKIGVKLNTSGPGTIKVNIDGIFIE